MEMRRLLQLEPRSSRGHNALGQIYRAQNLYTQAIEELEKALEVSENDPIPAYNLGCLYRELEDWPLALKYYQEAVEKNPHFAPALYRLGAAYSDLGEPEKARNYFEEFLRVNPSRPALGHNNLAVLLWAQGEWEQAQEELKEAIRLEPAFPDALFNFGVCSLTRDREKEEGVKALLKYLKLRPPAPEGATLKRFLQKVGGVSTAEKALFSWEEYLEEGEKYEVAGQYHQAVKQYLRALALDPACSQAHYQLGLLYDRFLDNKIKAIQHYEKFLGADPQSPLAPEVITHLREARSQVGQSILARGSLPSSPLPEPVPSPSAPVPKSTPPLGVDDYYQKGLELEKSGHLARALSAYHKSLVLNPEFAPAHFQTGLVYLAQGRYEQAISSLERAQSLDSTLPVREHLGGAFLKQGDASLSAHRYVQALDYYRRAHQEGKVAGAEKGLWEAHHAFFQDSYERGDFSSAASHLRACLELRPKEARDYVVLGDIYAQKLGRTDRARQYYAKYLEYAPEGKEAERIIRFLHPLPRKRPVARETVTPLSAEEHYNRGARYQGKGKTAEAEEEYKKAVELKPNFFQAYYNLGILYNQTGRPAKALAAYKKAARLQPDFARVHLALFNLYYHQFKIKNLARRHARRYVELKPDSSRGQVLAEWLK